MKSIHLGKLFGLKFDLLPVTFLATLLLWMGLSAACCGIGIPLGESLLLGLVATLLHWTSLLLHHLGHFIASRRAGYPMAGILFGVFGLLARDLSLLTNLSCRPSFTSAARWAGPSSVVRSLLFSSCCSPFGLETGTGSAG